MNFETKTLPIAQETHTSGRALYRNRVRLGLYAILVLSDALSVLGAFAFGSWFHFGNITSRSEFDVAIAVLPIFLGTAFNSGAYSIAVLRSHRTGTSRVWASLAFAFASTLLLFYYLRVMQDLSREAMGISMVTSFLLVTVARTLFSYGVGHAIKGDVTSELVILDDMAITCPPHVAVLDAHRAALKPDLRDPMMLNRLAARLRGIDRVVIACRPEAQRSWAMLLKGANIQAEIASTEFDAVGAIGIGKIGDRSTLVVATGPLSLRNRILKRSFDLCFAVPALVVLMPLLILIAIAIKADSAGPVFFKQKRVGRGNALFEVYKFRSMRSEMCDPDGNVSSSRDDLRITRVGSFIRKTSLDELPQLLNVLFGSMSIVGPRPHALGSLAGQDLFWDVDERYWHRHALKPGITGLAQVRGFRGATSQRGDLTRRLQADLEYIAGWSIWRDFEILVSTITVVVHKNAF
ncbi:sugar transferase [Sphingomonas sp. 37zxx]|uniref:sugar transferase n=1 Tax=Sphingomonas sp. 37zxx TaxID=1550073 RepID=UPI000AA4AC08|nr:sugar transferase [Sphingomonas sp. 37zxx]